MKSKYLLLLFFLGCSLVLSAQHIAVKDFYYAENDLTARTHGTSVEDQNGNLCALIKLRTTEKGLWAFDVGMLGVKKTEMQNAAHPAEIWVYVPFSVTRMTIQHEKLGIVDKWSFPCSIEKGCTYVMEITIKSTPEPRPDDNKVKQQYLIFQMTPADAALEVNDQLWPVSNGTARKFVDFGTYTYRVQAPNYHSEVGRVTVDDPNNKKIVPVNLKPNYGWVEVKGNSVQGADVYIDNAYIGKAPCKSGIVKSGAHTVKIAKAMYESYTEEVTVNDEQICTVEPKLTADFARLTLTVDADAEIWVDEEKKGVRTWTGNLGTGTHTIECRMANHESSLITKEVNRGMDGQTITLTAPPPICGSLNVESTPDFAKIYIDGKAMGETPNFIPEILIGSHEIRLTKEGYAEHTETVTIAKGERKQVTATLSNGKEIQFTCNVPNARLEIDGKQLSSANGLYMLTFGNHSLRVTATDYQDYTANLSVTQGSSGSYSIQMQSVMKSKETFTVNGVSFTMKLVEGGTFRMGAQKSNSNGQNYDSEANNDESPVHSVTLSNYYMAETEVTQALWKAVMGNNPSYFKGDNLPVEYVSWDDCQEFINKLNQKTGKNFRLPTEAEWEYAAKGGKKSKSYKYSGSNNVDEVCWYWKNSGDKYLKDNDGDWTPYKINNNNCKTHVVKSKLPNELGLYDMSGNVSEWCQDKYEDYRSGSQVKSSRLIDESPHVLRGGDWRTIARNCRVSSRSFNNPDYPGHAFYTDGFRLCLPQ